MDVESRGCRVHYEVAGDGPALVLLPGLLQSGQNWIEYGYVASLCDEYRVITVDMIGHGQSDKPGDVARYAGPEQASDVVAVLDQQGVDVAHVWGYSGGAVHATGVAMLHPARVGSVTAGGAPPNLPLEVRDPIFQPWVDALRQGDWESFWATFLPLDPADQAKLQEANDPVTMAVAIEGLLPWQPDLSTISAPFLMYMGSDELCLDLVRTEAEGAGADFEVIEGQGHGGAFIERDLVEPFVRDHIARATSDSTSSRP